MSYIGNPIVSTDFPVDYASGNGSTTAFTLSIAPASVNAVDVEVSGVSQSPQTYTISGTTLTFSAAPPSGTNNIVFKHRGVAGIPNTPSASSVTTSSIAANAVTPTKMANGGAEFGMRNRIINGGMVIDQRNAGASVSADNSFPVDRFKVSISGSATATAQQSSTVPIGFSKSLVYTVGTGAAQGTSSVYRIFQAIEGFNTADLNWGTANAKTVTVSFWVRSSVTGTFSGSLNEANGGTASYVFEFSVNSANTWEQKSITITGATVGTWQTTNSASIAVVFDLGSGTNYQQTAGSWTTSANKFRSSGSVVLSATSGATFYITGIQLEVGSSATGYEYVNYQTSLANCQRYYWNVNATGNAATYFFNGFGYTSTQFISVVNYPVTMRASPTLTTSGTASDYRTVTGSNFIVSTSVPFIDSATRNSVDVIFTASGITSGQGGMSGSNTVNAFLGFNAEL